MSDIGKLSNTEKPEPLGPVAGGSQRRRNPMSYKASTRGHREENSPAPDDLAQEMAALVGADEFDMTLTTDQYSGEALIRVTDRRSGRLIREVKPEELVRASLAQTRGLFVNKRG